MTSSAITPTDLAHLLSFPRLSFLQTTWLLGLFSRVSAGYQRHRNYPDNPEVFSLATSEVDRMFHGNASRVKAALFNLVDESFTTPLPNRKGVTRAYQWRDGIVTILQRVVIPEEHARPSGAPTVEYISSRRLGDRMRDLALLLEQDPDNEKAASRMAALSHLLMVSDYDAELDQPVIKVDVFYRQNKTKGRRFAMGPSLQGLAKEDRMAIMVDATDIDMVNAHPTIINALYEGETGKRLPGLARYTAEREEALLEIMGHFNVPRSAAKKLVLQTSYGASTKVSSKKKAAMPEWLRENGLTPREWVIDGAYDLPEIVEEISADLKEATRVLLATERGEYFLRQAQGYPARALALLVQSVESNILDFMRAYLDSKGVEVQTLVFDGLIAKGRVSKRALRELEDLIARFTRNEYGVSIPIRLTGDYYNAVPGAETYPI